MTGGSEMKWCSTKLFRKLFLVLVLLQYSLGFDLFEEEKRQGGLIPAARLGRDTLLTTLEDLKPKGNMLSYPRIGRRFWELHRTLIPYPRAGRYVVDPESLDYDILLNSDYGSSGLEDTLTDAFLSNPLKRSMKLVPRIGRKKRSVSEENSKEEDKGEMGNEQKILKVDDGRSFFDDLEDIEPDYYFRSEKKSMRSKSAFVPRVGKKASDDIEGLEEKRAMAFTPRVGRAALIPRIGRNDLRFRLMSRAALIPRVGRRASFIPRVGRSGNVQNENENSD